MAELPDIDTTQVGLLSYWNALDHGVSSIDPSEVLTESTIKSYDQYDNGVEGVLTLSYASGDAQFRVKTDGWFVVWIDRTKQFGTSSPGRGFRDVIRWKHDSTPNPSLPRTTFSEAMNRLHAELSNSSSITFNHSDTGIYCYEYTGATTLTLADEQDYNMNGEISYSSSTDRKVHECAGATDESNYGNSLAGSKVIADGATYGARDVIAAGLMPNSGTYYQHGDQSNNSYQKHMTHVMVWA